MTQSEWKYLADDYHETGSRYVCDPPVTDTDHDWIVLDGDGSVEDWLARQQNVVFDGLDYDDEEFNSFKLGEVNLIVMSCEDAFDRFVLATKISKLLNVQEKPKRVALFEANRHGEWVYDTE